jgi:hypothetical protein
MTTKVVQLIVEIPDSAKDKAPLDNEQLCNAVALYLEPFQVCYRVQVTEIKVTRTNPSFVHVPNDDIVPIVHELHEDEEQHEELREGDKVV